MLHYKNDPYGIGDDGWGKGGSKKNTIFGKEGLPIKREKKGYPF